MLSNTVKEVIFFLLIGTLFFLTSFGPHLAKDQNQGKFLKVIIPVIFTLATLGLFYLLKFNKCGEGYVGGYASLQDVNNTPMFTLSTADQCQGGQYLHSSDDVSSRNCQRLSESPGGCEKLKYGRCPKGQYGRRVEFEFTPDSGPDWQNKRCVGNAPCAASTFTTYM